MATLDTSQLSIALSLGILKPKLSEAEKQVYRQSIVTACDILGVIKKHPQGLSRAQIEHYLKLNLNTTRQFLQWLEKNKLIKSEPEKTSKIYFLV